MIKYLAVFLLGCFLGVLAALILQPDPQVAPGVEFLRHPGVYEAAGGIRIIGGPYTSSLN